MPSKKSSPLSLSLPLILSMGRRLERYTRELGLSYRCPVIIKEYSPAYDQNEDGVVYSYPERISVKIESHSNHWFDVRVSDGRWIREGKILSGKGLSAGQVYKQIRQELKDHAAQIKQIESIKSHQTRKEA
jgi:hypothetical protein